MESHTDTSKNGLRVCDCFAVWELESSGYLVHQEKKKRSLTQTGRCLHGNSLPSCEGPLSLVESQQEPQLEIKFELEIMALLFFYGTLLSISFPLHLACRVNMTVTKWKYRTCTSHWLILSPLIKSSSTNELKEHGISSKESEVLQCLWG